MDIATGWLWVVLAMASGARPGPLQRQRKVALVESTVAAVTPMPGTQTAHDLALGRDVPVRTPSAHTLDYSR